MPIAIEELRESVDEKYVGIRLNTSKVKPVHIANGLFREACEWTADTGLLHKFVFDQKANGDIPRGHELDNVIDELRDLSAIEPNIDPNDVSRFRRQLKKVVSADDGVFTGQMQSYSAAARGFLSRDTVGQDAGSFIVSWLKYINSDLLAQIQSCLQQTDDIVSLTCAPLISDEGDYWERKVEVDDLKFTSQQLGKSSRDSHWNGLNQAATTLANHLEAHPDKLFHMRLVVLFSSVVVLRHVAALESYYVKDAIVPPFLLDFGNVAGLKGASRQSYSRCRSSISRFYAYAFGQEVKRSYSVQDLANSKPPRYNDGKNAKLTEQGDTIWKLTKSSVNSRRNKFTRYGEALFDILSLNANATAIQYFKGLGARVGLIHPRTGSSAVPWFRPTPDLIELLIHCCIEPDEEPVEMQDLCNRMQERFGVLTGGGRNDEEILEKNAIYSWDRDALNDNARELAYLLVRHGFASELADGVTKVSAGGASI